METQDIAYHVEQKTFTAPPVKWRWVTSATGPSPKPRHGHRAVAIRDLMVVFGGGNEGIVDELHVYNTVTNSWYMPEVRGDIPPGSAAYGIVCRDTNIYVFGGMIEFGRYSNELYELQASRWEWRKLRPRPPRSGQAGPCPRLGHSFTLGSDGMSYVFGGLTHESTPEGAVTRYLNDLYVVDLKNAPNGLQWVCPQTHGLSPTPRESHSAVIVENGTTTQLVIYGGMCGRRLGDVWILDLLSLTWTSPTMHGVPPEPRSLHTANLVGDRMYIFGGWVPVPPEGMQHCDTVKPEWRCTNTLGIFNVNTLTWEQPAEPVDSVDGLPRPRAGHCSVVINQRIYIWSGRDGYRKSWNTQICCKDMYFLETSSPMTPAQIQLVRATMTSLDLTWTSVANADAYILQVQRCGSSSAPNEEGTEASPQQQQLAPRRPIGRIATGHTPVKLVPAGRVVTSSSQPAMKVLRTVPSSAARGQVLRVVTPRGGLAHGGLTQSPLRPGGQKTIYLARPSGGPGASQAASVAVPGQRVVLVQQQQPSAVQHPTMSQTQQHVAHVQPRQVVTTYTSSPYQQQPQHHQVQRQIVTTSYQAPEPTHDSPPVLQQQVRHISVQQQQPDTTANVLVHQQVQPAVPAGVTSHIVSSSQPQPAAYSQGYGGTQRATYVSSLSSNIDQQMPHNILDEALNEAENYDAGEDVQVGMEVGDSAASVRQQEPLPDVPYAAEQGYAQQSTAPSVPAHAGHGSGPSALRSANIPQLDGAGSLEDSDNEADAATETSGSQQSGASHSDTTAGGGATASDSRETVASDAAPTVTTEGEEAGSDNQAAENVPVTGEHSNVSAQEPHSEEEQAAADSYGPDPTPFQRREASSDPSQPDAQVTASEPGAASSWPPDSSTSPEISIGASHFPQSQTAVEAQPALSSSPGPPSSTFQGQAQEGHYAIPHAMFETVEDPLQAAVAEIDSFEEDPEQLASSVATPVQHVPEPEQAHPGGGYGIGAPAYQQQNYAVMMNVPPTHEDATSGVMTPSYHQMQQHPQDPTSTSYDQQVARAAAASPSVHDAQHNYAQQARPAETIQQQPQEGYYAQQAPATQYVVSGQSIPVQPQESGGYTMRTTTGAYPRQGVHGQVRQVGIARPQVAVSSMTRQPPQPAAQGASVDAPDVWHDVAIIRGNTYNVKEYLVSERGPNSQGYAYVEGTLQPIHDRVPKKLALEPGALYRFRIAAINACGRSPWLASTAFKTCIPGFPGAPSSIKITKSLEGAQLTWEPPVSTNGTITEYSVYLAVRGSVVNSDAQLAFVRVYAGTEPRCIVSSANLGVAHVENSARPAVIFRIAAKNEKGYGPATQVRWLQEAQRPLAGTGAPIYAAPSAGSGGGFYQRAGAGGPQAASGGSSPYYPTTKRLRLE